MNDRERDAGYRNCISFDEATQQVVLSVGTTCRMDSPMYGVMLVHLSMVPL